MAIALTVIVFIIICVLNRKKKSSVWLILGWMIISPSVTVGNMRIDSIYLLVIGIFLYILIQHKRIGFPKDEAKHYLIMILSIHVIYTISWLLFSRIDSSSMFSSLLGAIKIVLLLVECWNLNKQIKRISYIEEITKAIIFMAITNSLAVAYEMTNFASSIMFLKTNWLNMSSSSYLDDCVKWGYYARYFGVMAYPMDLGMFAGYSITFLISSKTKLSLAKKGILLVDLFVLGILSVSKSFVLTTAIGIVFFAISSIIQETGSSKKKFYGMIIVAVFFVFFFNLRLFQNIITNILGEGYAKYFSFLYDISGALDARTGNAGALSNSQLYSVILDNLIFGVGPSSIIGEPVMDNAYLIILHNGGIIALAIVLSWYIFISIKNKKQLSFICMIVVIVASGFGFETLTSPISSWILFPMLIEIHKEIKQKKQTCNRALYSI